MEGFKSSLTSEQIEERLLKDGVGVIEVPVEIVNLSLSSSEDEVKNVVDNIYQQYLNVGDLFISIIKEKDNELQYTRIIPITLMIQYAPSDNLFVVMYSISIEPSVIKNGIIGKMGDEYNMSSISDINLSESLLIKSTPMELKPNELSSFSPVPEKHTVFVFKCEDAIIGSAIVYRDADNNIKAIPEYQVVYTAQSQYKLHLNGNTFNTTLNCFLEEISNT